MGSVFIVYLIGFATICSVLAKSYEEDNGDSDSDIFSNIFDELHKDMGPPAKAIRAAVQTKWIKQKLDHFDEKESRSWKMRYMVNDEFHEPSGPIFVHVGGEWAIQPGFISSGQIYDMAKEFKGYLFYTEHRFYGKSKPVRDLATENLKYLNVRQALADLAHFIVTIKSTVAGLQKSKVILTGGSYSGAMVTWFKKLYPDLVVGCWASSAPLMAKLDFFEYKEVTGQSIRLMGGDDCYNRIQNGIRVLEDTLMCDNSNALKEIFNLCPTFDEANELDVYTLFFSISNIFAGIVQNHSNNTIQNACSKLMEGSDDVSGLRNYLDLTFKSHNKCNEVTYKALVKSINYNNFGNKMYRQWTYQTCNEFGWIQSSNSTSQPFGTKFPTKLYTSICYDVFGKKFTEDYIEARVNQTNAMFDGLQPQVQNVYFTHGQLDPWRAMGIQEEGNATIIPYNAHCKDFGSISDRDSQQLRDAKENLTKTIGKWLQDSCT